MRTQPTLLLAVLMAVACESPQQYGPIDANGPAVATVPRSTDAAQVAPSDAMSAADDVRTDATTSQEAAVDSVSLIDSPVAHDAHAPEASTGVPMDASPALDRAPDVSPDVPTGPPPVVVRVPEASAPSRRPAGTKVTCLAGPTVLEHADCPVIRWQDHSYWALSYSDNRIAATLVAFDASGRIVKELIYDNVRYVWNMEVDEARKEVVLHFQDDRIAAVAWDDLRVP